MLDKAAETSRIYTDVQGLEKLRAMQNTDPSAARKEVAEQFEAILMQMVLHSMRDANKALASDDLFGGQEMEMYQDIYDKQLTLMLSHNRTGFASMIEQNMAMQEAGARFIPGQPIPQQPSSPVVPPTTQHAMITPQIPTAITNEITQHSFHSPEEFVKKLWPIAKSAAAMIGVSPKVLLAQAALETNWGKKIIQHPNAASTHNLFNIKTGSKWDKSSATMDTLEQKNGILIKEKSQFRSYGSFNESFSDYINFLKQNDRYSDAVNKANNPHEFVNALQNAGYATDEKYADKIMNIFSSHSFKELIAKVE